MSDKMISRLAEGLSHYLSRWVVFLFDLIVSIAATGVTILISGCFQKYELPTVLFWFISSFIGSVVMFMVVRSYRIVIRHTSATDILKYFFVSFGKAAFILLCYFALNPEFHFIQGAPKMAVLFFFLDMALTFLLIVLTRIVMITVYTMLVGKMRDGKKTKRVLVYSTTEKAVATIKRLQSSPHYKIIGFISSTNTHGGMIVSELPVYTVNSEEELSDLADRLDFKAILFISESDARKEQGTLIRFANSQGISTLIAPAIDNITANGVRLSGIRDVKIEDLLGRDEIKISMDRIVDYFHGKTVMVTGAAGSIGSELCRQLASFRVEKLILFDNAETPMHNLRLELEKEFPELSFVPIIGDVRLVARLDFSFRNWHPQVVFHAAAYKHVPLMEENPCEAVLVNVIGSRNVADKCIEYGVEKMVMISTDKAVNPTNIMGCTKRLAEMYVQSLGQAVSRGDVTGKTTFVTTRFGNVLGSNGSVIPRFRQQIEAGGPVTVTHPDITRFFMTIPEACRLVMEAATMASGNEIFVFDMGESVKIDTLARRMIELAGLVPDVDIKVSYIGLRPGEKLYEEVLANEENTTPTGHDRIRVAKIRDYDYEKAVSIAERLETLSRAVDIPTMVKLMKEAVPEFISKNSRFEIYDRK